MYLCVGICGYLWVSVDVTVQESGVGMFQVSVCKGGGDFDYLSTLYARRTRKGSKPILCKISFSRKEITMSTMKKAP